MLKILLIILCVIFIYRTLSRFIFGSIAADTKERTTKNGRNITYQDADYEEID